ncbi:hypothetical protein GCM10023166_03450 [Paeniglutamicibacter cryotolerans]|uniref:Uncharacterized protein n=2 Tax=Paeniglutamicibacter cryotolerans TaxID=670079 RepID=A0A839QEH2_9MICC|nr:hypothetical protein [Paeniglutamicibacter cryotolerans]
MADEFVLALRLPLVVRFMVRCPWDFDTVAMARSLGCWTRFDARLRNAGSEVARQLRIRPPEASRT